MNFTNELIIATSIVGAIFGLSIILMLFRLTRVGIKTLKFDTNGGNQIKRMKIRKGKKVLLASLPTPTKEDDEFVCWCENITLSKKLEGFIMPPSDKKVYAKWNSDIIKEKEKAELEKRKPVFNKKVEPSKEMPKFEQTKRPEQFKQQAARPSENVRPTQSRPTENVRPTQSRPAENVRPTQSRPAENVRPAQSRPAENVRPAQAQSARPAQATRPAQPAREGNNSTGYQYQFRQASANASQTYAYSKYNSSDIDKLDAQEQDAKLNKDNAKLELISKELHYSIESLKILDEQNIDILYRKAEKSRKAKELNELNKQREVYRANLKRNQYSRTENEEKKPLGDNKPKVEENQIKPSMVSAKPEAKVELKQEPKAEKELEQQGYSSQINNIVIDEIVEEAEEPVVEAKKEEKQNTVNNDVKPEATNTQATSKSKNADKIEKLDQINKNFDKLNNELAELKELLLRSIK